MTPTSEQTLRIPAPRGHVLRDVAFVTALLVGIAAFLQTVRL